MSDEEEGEIVSDEEETVVPPPVQNAKVTSKPPMEDNGDEKKEEKKQLSIGDLAAKILQKNQAMRMASETDRIHEDDRSRKRHHHRKDKRRRRDSSEGSIHRKHQRRHDRKRSRSRSRSKSRSRSPHKKNKKEEQRSTCKYYQEGKCQKGDDCPFVHAGDQAKRTDLCRFYVSGHCIKRNCPFMHDDFPCKFFHTGAPCFADKNCRFSHAPLTDAMSEVLKRYLDECKGLNREDLERLSMKAKERDDRKGGPKGQPEDDRRDKLNKGRGPLLELPPALRQEPQHFGSGDIDLRIPPPSVEDVDYRLPVANQPQSPPQSSFYRDTMESPVRNFGNIDSSSAQDGSTGRGDNGSRFSSNGDSHESAPRISVERPSDPRERKASDLPEIPKSQRDLLMRLQQRVEKDHDSQGSQEETGGRTPMADEDIEESRDGGANDDSDDDHNLADVVKSVKERQPPAPANIPADLASIISSISSAPSQTPDSAGNQTEYWKQLLSIAGYNPATGTPAQTPASPPQTSAAPITLDPRRARDPRQAAAAVSEASTSLPSRPVLPIFPTLEVTTVIESHDGDAPYVLRPIETSPANYENFIHLVKIDFKLKSDPRLIKFLEKAAEKEKIVDTPQSPPPQAMYCPPLTQPPGVPPGIRTPLLPLPPFLSGMQAPLADLRMPGMRAQLDPRFQGGAPMLMNPRFQADPRSQDPRADPRVQVDPRAQADPRQADPRVQADPRTDNRQMDPRMANARLNRGTRSLPPPDPRLGLGTDVLTPMEPTPMYNQPTFNQFDPRRSSLPRQMDPRSANRDPRRSNGHTEPAAPGTDPQPAVPAFTPRPAAPAFDPRQAADPRKAAIEEKPAPDMSYSSPLSGYDGKEEQVQGYQRRNIGRIKKKTPPAMPAAPAATQPEKADPGEALPPPPSLLSHPVDPYGNAGSTDDKPLSEMFKQKDPTASPFN